MLSSVSYNVGVKMNLTEKHSHPQKRVIPLTDWSKYHPWPPLGGLRHLAFHAKQNGFDRVIRRVGRRILIDEDAFFDWVQSNHHNQKQERIHE